MAKQNLIIVLIVLVVCGVGYSVFPLQERFVQLYPVRLSEQSNEEVSQALSRLNIEHELDPTVGVMVHPDSRAEVRAKLAAMGLPRVHHSSVSHKEHIPTEMEREVTESLLAIPAIEDARVKISRPTRGGPEKPRPSVRVYLKIADQGFLSDTTLGRIHEILSRIDPKVAVEEVQIVDSTGRQISP